MDKKVAKKLDERRKLIKRRRKRKKNKGGTCGEHIKGRMKNNIGQRDQRKEGKVIREESWGEEGRIN